MFKLFYLKDGEYQISIGIDEENKLLSYEIIDNDDVLEPFIDTYILFPPSDLKVEYFHNIIEDEFQKIQA